MTMKQRIFLTNTAMVLISLLIFFGIAGAGVFMFRDDFMDILKQNAKLPGTTYDVETIIKAAQKNAESWEAIDKKINKYDFDLYVSDSNSEEQFSTVSHRAMECIEELERGQASFSDVKLYSMENVAIIKCQMTRNGETFNVYATHSARGKAFAGIDHGMFETFIIAFIVGGIFIIAALLVCTQIFTRLMIRRIMKPVDELGAAAKRINDGNLDQPIIHANKDEFTEVCNTFNDMQVHLKEGIEQAEAYERARSEMISGISHDLRTPLTSVKGFIKGMLDGVAATPEKQRQYLEISYRKACDMEVLLQKLFFLSKLETGKMPFFKQDVAVAPWMEKYVAGKKIEGLNEDYTIALDIGGDVGRASIDPEQTRRVFDNIIENSKKYADAENLHIDISVSRDQDVVIFRIADNGKGIEDEKLEHVFEQFYRGDESRNSRNAGNGLGLYVCKYIVEEQGGRITASSDYGFCVTIELPAVKKEEAGGATNG